MEHIYNCTGHDLLIPDVVDSEGVYLVDQAGKRYMDLESGVWCASVGHKNERVNAVIKDQLDRVIHAGFCYANPKNESAAETVLSLTGFEKGKCVFLCSGSEAIELSRQIAKHLSGEKKSMTLHDSYLGSYSSVTDRSQGWYLFDWRECETCAQKETCDPDCEALQAIPADVSEFIFEPGSASGFVRFPPKALIEHIVRIVRGNGGWIIANEVTTGIGRTGKWFGYQHYDIEPDMVAMGKGIGNGYPVSVAALRGSVLEALTNKGKPFKYMQSHQNDPLGAAVVSEVIAVIQDDDLIAKAAQKGRRFLTQLESLVDGETILAVRGRGLMFAVDLADEDVADRIYRRLIERGYIVCNRGTAFRIDPPLIITEDEFAEFIHVFRSSV